MRFLKVCIIALILLFSLGCATRHHRLADDIDQRSAHLSKVLILTPQLDVKMKYISTDHFLVFPPKTEESRSQLTRAYREELEKRGYEVALEPSLQYQPESLKIIDEASSSLQKMSEEILRQDLEYQSDKLTAQSRIKLESEIPEEWKKYDAVILCHGKAQLETNAEFKSRWIKNVTLNILLLPLAFTSYFLPITWPITLSTSSFVFQKSPDKCYTNMIILDLKDKSVIYQYNYFIEDWGLGDDIFYEIGNDMMREFRPSLSHSQDKAKSAPAS